MGRRGRRHVGSAGDGQRSGRHYRGASRAIDYGAEIHGQRRADHRDTGDRQSGPAARDGAGLSGRRGMTRHNARSALLHGLSRSAPYDCGCEPLYGGCSRLFRHLVRYTFGCAFRLTGDDHDRSRHRTGSVRSSSRRVHCRDRDERWLVRREALEGLLGEALPARIALRLSAGAHLPADQPAVSEFVAAVREAAVKLVRTSARTSRSPRRCRSGNRATPVVSCR